MGLSQYRNSTRWDEGVTADGRSAKETTTEQQDPRSIKEDTTEQRELQGQNNRMRKTDYRTTGRKKHSTKKMTKGKRRLQFAKRQQNPTNNKQDRIGGGGQRKQWERIRVLRDESTTGQY